jgi:REP element-mobilizing transposase RayT
MSSGIIPDRKRLRAEGYDYHEPGWYFVTLCTQDRKCVFGAITNDLVELSPAGQMVDDHIRLLPEMFPNVGVDSFVTMPNHIHAIITLEPVAGERSPVSLSDFVAAYKRITTHDYIRNVRESGWPPFPGKLWQRSFHDTIIRSDRQVDRLRDYIEANPYLWSKDTYYHPA